MRHFSERIVEPKLSDFLFFGVNPCTLSIMMLSTVISSAEQIPHSFKQLLLTWTTHMDGLARTSLPLLSLAFNLQLASGANSHLQPETTSPPTQVHMSSDLFSLLVYLTCLQLLYACVEPLEVWAPSPPNYLRAPLVFIVLSTHIVFSQHHFSLSNVASATVGTSCPLHVNTY